MSALLRVPLILLALGVTGSMVIAQPVDPGTVVEWNNGLSVHQDSIFRLQLRFRMQNRFGIITAGGDDLDVAQVDARVRRLRLRFEGFVLDPRLRYYVQLNFSHADLDMDTGGPPKPVRDAMVYYHVNDRFHFGLGQTKLPGNRQRLVSSGNLQFPDRSIANNTFTLDRDIGIFANHTLPIGGQVVRFKGAVSSGEGRSAPVGNSGLGYTGRVEWLPLGAFANDGDFSEGDLEMEPRPRLALGASLHRNERARRTGGQLGWELYAPRSFNTLVVDGVLKYRGWAVSAEYFDRHSDDPLTTNAEGDVRFVPTGQGLNVQLSKYWRGGYEVAGSYSMVRHADNTRSHGRDMEDIWLGASRYINGHRIKMQWYVGYSCRDGDLRRDHPGNAWTTLVQMEFGI